MLALLGLPTAALALAITVVTTYLPVVAHEYLGSTTVIGVLIGLEGVMALWVPLVVGAWSDDLRTPLGGAAAVPDRGDAARRREPDADRLRERDGGRRDLGGAVLPRLLRRVRAVPRAVPGPRRDRGRRTRAELAGDLPRRRDRDRARRWRPAGDARQRGAVPVRSGRDGGDDGPVRRRRATADAGTPARCGDRRRLARTRKPARAARRPARSPRAAPLPARERAVGGLAVGAQDVRLPVRRDRRGPERVGGGRDRRRRRARRADRRADLRCDRRPHRAPALRC